MIAMGTPEIIAENQVTTDTLESLFRRAFFSTSLDDDGDVCVETDDPIVYVSINASNKLIKYTAVYRFKESVSMNSKLVFVNKMNDDVIFCRFSVSEDNPELLIADYFLPYGEGLPAFQIVSALRLFARVAPRIIHDCDEHDIVR